ncbi:cystin-1 [Mirounga leonina]|uniref:cystin-1 n=1 Tax=Mirounga leonina TaxID=9715 RepID=UPI00156BF7EC|nr:cystin-1 [Mirounga leonina]
MGSGSSRSGRALRRLRSPDSRPAGPGGAASEGGTRPLVSATAAAATREEAREAEAAEGAADPDPDPGPAAPPDGGDETLRLLDQLLAESAAWGPGELVPRGPARPRPAAAAGSPVSSKQSADEHPESGRVSRAPGGSHGRPERQSGSSAISYDCSEEELMASIEREYCR